VITMIGYFQLFAEPYVMTRGGPLRSTTSLVLLMYEEGFRWWRMGNAAALAFLLFIVILVATLVQTRLQRKEPKKQIPRRFAPRDDNLVIPSEARDLLPKNV